MKITYEYWLELQQYRPRTIETLVSIQRHLESYLTEQGMTLSERALQDYSSWALSQGYSSKYEGQLYWGLNHYVHYLEQVEGVVYKLYLPGISARSSIRPALSDSALKRVHEWLLQPHRDYWLRRSLWSLFYGCGLRRSELLGLQLSDLNIKEQVLKVKTVKGGKPRLLPLSKTQLRALSQYLEVERPRAKAGFEPVFFLGRRGGKAEALIAQELIRWQSGTGLGTQFTWHALRHSIATKLVHEGMSLEQVSQFLGHRSLYSTSRYLHTTIYHSNEQEDEF